MAVISHDRAILISQAVRKDNLAAAKDMATKTSILDDVRKFFSVKFFHGSFATQLEEKNKLISDIVDQAFTLKQTFERKISALDPNTANFHYKLQTVVMDFNKSLPANNVDQIKYCFGYNAKDKNIVLRMRDGERHEDIKILDLSQSTISDEVLNVLPKHWVGGPNDRADIEIIEMIKSSGGLPANPTMFFKDGYRQNMNGNDSTVMLEKINEASKDKPSFISKSVNTTPFNNQVLNAYESILNEINPEFSDRQKNMFIMLCSQDAIVGRGGFGGRSEAIGFKGEDVKVVVSTGKNNEMIFSASCKTNMVNNESLHDDFNQTLGEMTLGTKFSIDTNGLVKCIDCSASMSINDESTLTTAQAFAIEYFKEAYAELSSAFKDSALKEIQSTESYKQTEAYVRELRKNNSITAESNRTFPVHDDLPALYPRIYGSTIYG
jgi:hypothetical protein